MPLQDRSPGIQCEHTGYHIQVLPVQNLGESTLKCAFFLTEHIKSKQGDFLLIYKMETLGNE